MESGNQKSRRGLGGFVSGAPKKLELIRQSNCQSLAVPSIGQFVKMRRARGFASGSHVYVREALDTDRPKLQLYKYIIWDLKYNGRGKKNT